MKNKNDIRQRFFNFFAVIASVIFFLHYCTFSDSTLKNVFWWIFGLGIVDKFRFSVCNFQSMKIPMELNSLLSKIFCYMTWSDATLGELQTRHLRQILLFLGNNSLAVSKLQTVLVLSKIERTNKLLHSSWNQQKPTFSL